MGTAGLEGAAGNSWRRGQAAEGLGSVGLAQGPCAHPETPDRPQKHKSSTQKGNWAVSGGKTSGVWGELLCHSLWCCSHSTSRALGFWGCAGKLKSSVVYPVSRSGFFGMLVTQPCRFDAEISGLLSKGGMRLGLDLFSFLLLS